MKTIKVSEATKIQIDYLVAEIEGVTFPRSIPKYSSDWAQGGQIIEREGIELLCNLTATEAARFSCGANADWQAFYRNRRRTEQRSFATTPLLAAMRCFVVSKLGDAVEVPEELG